MELGPLSKIAAATAAEINAGIELGPEARALLADGATPGAFLGRLIEAKHYPDAVRFLARALRKREAVWWACICVRATLPAKPAAEIVAALEAAESWVYKPSEPKRRAAMERARAAQFASAASWAAVGAFWSGGSMAPPDQPVVPPGDDLTGKAVAGAVMLAAVETDPAKADERYRDFIERGIDLAKGGTGKKAGQSTCEAARAPGFGA